FQAEDGIRDFHVTGVQTCALPIYIPVLSEESAEGVATATRRQWPRLWVVDPLDGTREFVKRNGEFTVNIALVDQGVPVLGVVQEIGRASCRGRGGGPGGAGALERE